MFQPTLAHTLGKLSKLAPGANKQETEGRVVAYALCRCEDGFKLVSPAQISRIADNEPVFEPPFTAQRVVENRYWLDFLVVAPVRYDADTFRRDAARADDLRHAFPNHHIGVGRAWRIVPKMKNG